jgi:hypothetical protein
LLGEKVVEFVVEHADNFGALWYVSERCVWGSNWMRFLPHC